VNTERVLIFLLARGEGYARGIARFWGADPDSIQKQLVKFETRGVLTSKQVGQTVLYQFNARYAFLPELKQLLEKALSYYPESEREQLLISGQLPS